MACQTPQNTYMLVQSRQLSVYAHICPYVCMNNYILKIIRAKVTKLADKITYCWLQLKIALKYNHAPKRLLKSLEIKVRPIKKSLF